jgi:hypothetical protein
MPNIERIEFRCRFLPERGTSAFVMLSGACAAESSPSFFVADRELRTFAFLEVGIRPNNTSHSWRYKFASCLKRMFVDLPIAIRRGLSPTT